MFQCPARTKKFGKLIMSFYRISCLLLAGAFASGSAIADDSQNGWSGEGAFSAGYTSGNTETADVGIGLDLSKVAGIWTYNGNLVVDYGEQDGLESRNRVFVAGQVDRAFGDRAYMFGRASYEVDQFTGFDSRTFIGAGFGYSIYDLDDVKWSISGGPGVKIDEVKRIITTDEMGAALIIPAETETSFGAVARSEYAYNFNENVSLTNDSGVTYGQESTQIENILALTAALNSSLSARVSFEVRHDTNPPIGFEDTDTATKLSVVYKFGD